MHAPARARTRTRGGRHGWGSRSRVRLDSISAPSEKIPGSPKSGLLYNKLPILPTEKKGLFATSDAAFPARGGYPCWQGG